MSKLLMDSLITSFAIMVVVCDGALIREWRMKELTGEQIEESSSGQSIGRGNEEAVPPPPPLPKPIM